MLNLQQEKNRKISTQDAYDVISFAVQAADDEGFINTFVLERALYEYAAMIYYPDLVEKYSSKIAENPNGVWDDMLEDGTIDNMVKDYREDLDFLAQSAGTWADEYERYEQSVHGFLKELEGVLGANNSQVMNNFSNVVNNEALNEVTDIADKWGMNNTIPEEKDDKPQISLVKDDDDESLFKS